MPEFDIPAPLPFPGNLRALDGAVMRYTYIYSSIPIWT